METIRWFDELLLADVDAVGGKGANLGELTQAGFPVPPGFVVTQRRLPRDASSCPVRASGSRQLMAATDPADPDGAR